jgi:hypothetical protein
VVLVNSGAALAGSPLSGGYAGAKATQRFLTAYAQQEATRAGLAITFTAVLARIAPMTGSADPRSGLRRPRRPVRGGRLQSQGGPSPRRSPAPPWSGW